MAEGITTSTHLESWKDLIKCRYMKQNTGLVNHTTHTNILLNFLKISKYLMKKCK